MADPKKIVPWAKRAWAGLFLAGVALETYALIRKDPGDTLSEPVTKSVGHNPRLVGGLLAAGFGWLHYHWLTEPLWKRGHS